MMKIILVILIMASSFFVGYHYKQKIKLQYDFFVYLKDFTVYLESNVNMFKANMIEIIENFLVEKNAKFNEIFEKNSNLYSINEEKLKLFILKTEDYNVINGYFKMLGTNELDYEMKKIISFKRFLETKSSEYFEQIKSKGELFLKVALSVGAVIAILIW